jgi:multidrug efflux pump subunit AcrB
MWIVRLALRRPYTFIVLAIVILILGPLAILRTPTDIFPNINLPVVSIIWNYTGLSPEEMANRIVSITERSLTTTVDDIQHIESQSLRGVAVVKVFFQPAARIERAIAQVTAVSQTQLRQLPPGTTPPLVIAYSASSVPILQLALSGQDLSEQQLNDFALNFIRTRLVTVPGAAVPYPYGGKQRQVQVDLNPPALQARGLAPVDVVNALAAQNLILPAGTSKIGELEYDVDINGSPRTIAELNDLPIRTIRGSTTYIRDVANVRDGAPPQTNIVRVDGNRSSLLTILKAGNASTLDVIGGIKEMLPFIQSTVPESLRIRPLADQSFFVRASINGVLKEALIAACLTALMILLFLGSWRSTLIIAASIPLAILSSIIVLSALGETINIMTLGGLALAVGILVDDATVEIENINRQMGLGKERERAILDGAAEIAVPAFVSTLSICIVFVPMFLLSGVARYLFVPLAEAVVFAMLASYLLSRTLVPTLAKYLLAGHVHIASEEAEMAAARSRNPLVRFQARFEHGVERMRGWYRGVLDRCLHRRKWFLAGFALISFGSLASLVPFLGRDFFPSVDGGQFILHMRARTGTRIEETARLCDQIEQFIRARIPAGAINSIIDNIGLPYSGINLSYSNSAPIGPADADILVSLTKSGDTDRYVHALRLELAERFPGVMFAFLPADIVSQILNFGLPAPIDVQITGQDQAGNRAVANKLLARMRGVPGVVDLRIQQPGDQPQQHIVVDRTKADQLGITQRDVASNLLVSLSGSFQTAPTFWLNPKNGVSYAIATQTPQYRLDSLADLETISITGAGNPAPQLMASVATINRGAGMAVVSHYDIQPVIDIFGAVHGRDLGAVAGEVDRLVAEARGELPRGSTISVRGQVQTMRASYSGLLGGLAFAIVLVYLLIVVNFQSWRDPFIIIAALPAALAGIAWMFFLTRTHVSVPGLIGAIMCMGVATANSILVVSFANQRLREGHDPIRAALDAGFTRCRPVLMTALAMIIGMLPMAVGLGEGGEQNAPLGRAVIGGLALATLATLLFVPVVYSLMHRSSARAGAGTAPAG